MPDRQLIDFYIIKMFF